MGDVVNLTEPDVVGDGVVIDPDHVLRQTEGRFEQVVVIGFDDEGKIAFLASHGSREVLWALQRAQLHLLLETE